MKKFTIIILLLNLFLAASVFGQTVRTPQTAPASPDSKNVPPNLADLIGLKGQAAPPFALPAMDGASYDLADLRGKVVVINLWGTFCPPCITEIPQLNRLVEKYKNKDVVFLAPTPDDRTLLEGFLQKYPFKYQVLPDGFKVVGQYAPRNKSDVAQKKSGFVMLLPTHIIVDRAGVVAYHVWGAGKDIGSELSVEIERQLAKPVPSPAANGEKTSAGESTGVKSAGQTVENKTSSDAAALGILEKNLEAIGGRDAFAAIKSVEMQIERAVLGRTIKSLFITEEVAGSNRTYQRQEGGNGVTETGFDGQKAWQKAPFFRGYLDATNPLAKSLMRGNISLPGTSLYDYKTSGKEFERLADEQIGGKNYLVVKNSVPDEAGKETQVKYYFDPATYLVKQIVSGNAITQTETFDDYRKTGGIIVAFASTVTNPQVTLVSKITELKFNAPVNRSMFEFQETTEKSSEIVSKPGAEKGSGKIESPRVEKENELSETTRLETFERVWKTVNDTFYDRTFNGVNWQAVHDRYLPQATATAKSDDFHKLLNRMVQELHLSHFKVAAPSSVRTLGSGAAEASNGSIGLSLQYIENQLLVAGVKKDSPAALAGIRPGFILRRVNGKTPAELYAAYQKENSGFQLRENIARARSVVGELAGKADTKINLEFADAGDKSLNLELTRKAQPAVRELEFESKKLAGNIGYIKFNLFFGDVLPKFQTALNDLRDTKALIIDLRGNPGGAGDLAPAMANLLCSVPGSLGSLKYRYETTEYSYAGSGKQAYQGKIIVLTDEGTGSTSEVFAGGMQANKRAIVIGAPSAGAVLPSLAQLLPTGGALQYVVSDFQTPNGVILEGKGVTPDTAVKVSRTDLLAGRDAILERAMVFAKAGTS